MVKNMKKIYIYIFNLFKIFLKIVFNVNGCCPRDTARLPKGKEVGTGSWQPYRSLPNGQGEGYLKEG